MWRMWRWLAGFRCGRCDEVRGRGALALRSHVRPHLAICDACLETWERTGHRCSRCWMPILERMDVGLLVEKGAFAHVMCGGALVLGSQLLSSLGPRHPAGRVPRILDAVVSAALTGYRAAAGVVLRNGG